MEVLGQRRQRVGVDIVEVLMLSVVRPDMLSRYG